MLVLNKVTNSPHLEYETTAPIYIRLTNDKQGNACLSSNNPPFGKFGNKLMLAVHKAVLITILQVAFEPNIPFLFWYKSIDEKWQ